MLGAVPLLPHMRIEDRDKCTFKNIFIVICISQVWSQSVRSFVYICMKCGRVKYDIVVIAPLSVHLSLILAHRFIYCRRVLQSCSCACRTVFTHDKDVGEVVYGARRNLFTPVPSFAASFITVPTFRQALSIHASAFNSNLSTFPSLLPVSSKPTLYKTSLHSVTCSVRSLHLKSLPLHVGNFTDVSSISSLLRHLTLSFL
jgi:hypothetical protein